MAKLLTRLLTVVCAGFALATGQAFAQKTTLLVYTALETDVMKPYKDAFEKANPGVEIRWVRDSTGIITAKLLAEKANPQADFVMGLAATSLALLHQQGMLLPYEPRGFGELNSRYSDGNRPPAWVGMDVWGAAVCFNTIEAKKRALPRPETWKDLAKPVYKGAITMPHPASSGTGFLDVTAWLQLWGEAEAWKYMDALHDNVAAYTHSGSKPCRQAGAGEFPIGISFELRAHQTKASGAPIEIVFPNEGLGWDIEASAIMKNTKKLDAAKRLADWSASKQANELYQKTWAIVPHNSVKATLPDIPANYEQLLVKNDFTWSARNRDRILAEWTRRYGAKAEAK